MSVDGANDARAHAMRVQKLMASFREQGLMPPANLKGAKGGMTPAQRSAAALGVGDNLREAITDIHTSSHPLAPSWVDHLSTDLVNGDGSIQPELAFANPQLFGDGETLTNPDGMAADVSSLILDESATAVFAHRVEPGDTSIFFQSS
jgi:hypothetical protein